jgi:hypothetical protein
MQTEIAPSAIDGEAQGPALAVIPSISR